MQLMTPGSWWAVVVGAVVLAGMALEGVKRIASTVKMVLAPIRELIQEHDVLWEDYNIRTGGGYRRTTGRGTPPDPEEFYRKHPAAGSD